MKSGRLFVWNRSNFMLSVKQSLPVSNAKKPEKSQVFWQPVS